MPEETKPKPQNAEGGTDVPDPAPGPKASGTLKKGVQAPNAEAENPDQNPSSGSGGGKGKETWNREVEPKGRG
jgi:hypothetical protein